MKSHAIVKLLPGIPVPNIPYWGEVILNLQVKPATQLTPAIKQLADRYDLLLEVTHEYKPKSHQHWSTAERQAGMDRTFRLISRNDRPILYSFLTDLKRTLGVESVREGLVASAPIPRLFSEQLQIRPRGAGNMIGLNEAHQYTQGHQDITIAVLDTGIDLGHPELQHTLVKGYDFVDIISGAGKFFGDYLGVDDDPHDAMVGHGTHVAGIIAAKGNAMPIGVAPYCKVLPVRVLGAMKKGQEYVGAGLVDNINAGIKWAIDQGADIINMSLGIRHVGGGLPHAEVVSYAQSQGVTLIAASGNDGTDERYYPGALPHAISVGALDTAGAIAPYSTHGKVSFVAPGTNIYSSYTAGSYAFSTGTSQAAPFVTGLAALLKSFALQHGHTLTDRQLKYILFHTSDRLTPQLNHTKSGFGKINAVDALKFLKYKLTV